MTDLSIIIPAYNAAPWLSGCVQSIPAGPEIILVDDGSTDATGAVCDALARQDARIRVIHQANAGPSAARNAGLSAARGQYVWFLDADDRIDPQAIAVLEPLARRDRPDLIRFGYLACREGQPDRPMLPPYAPGLYTGPALEPLRLDTISYAHVLDYRTPRLLGVWSAWFRRDFLTAQGLTFYPQQEILSEDYLFLLQAIYAARRVCVCPRPLYRYQMRAGSLSHRPEPDMMEKKRRLCRLYCESVPLEDPQVRLRLRNFYIDCVYHCFTVLCRTQPHAVRPVARLLRDDALQMCLRKNRGQIRGLKTRCICFFMAHRQALAMCFLYKLCKLLGK